MKVLSSRCCSRIIDGSFASARLLRHSRTLGNYRPRWVGVTARCRCAHGGRFAHRSGAWTVRPVSWWNPTSLQESAAHTTRAVSHLHSRQHLVIEHREPAFRVGGPVPAQYSQPAAICARSSRLASPRSTACSATAAETIRSAYSPPQTALQVSRSTTPTPVDRDAHDDDVRGEHENRTNRASSGGLGVHIVTRHQGLGAAGPARCSRDQLRAGSAVALFGARPPRPGRSGHSAPTGAL